MFNKIIILSILLFVSKTVLTQPIITFTDLTPLIGETHSIYNCDSVNEGPSGINQTWNFSNIICGSTFPVNWVSSIGSSLSSASIVRVVGIDSTFYNLSGSYMEEIAQSNQTMGFVSLSDTFRQYIYPITYGDNVIDSFKYNPFIDNSFIHYKSGKFSYKVDGYGTLILPSGTYTNTLRLKIVEIVKDSLVGLTTTIDSFITYGWIKGGNHIGIAYKTSLYSYGSSIPLSSFFYYLNGIVTSNNDYSINNENYFESFPNPSSNIIYINIPTLNDNFNFKLFDVLGKEIPIKYHKNQTQNYSLSPLSKLNGIYYLMIYKNNKQVVTKKYIF